MDSCDVMRSKFLPFIGILLLIAISSASARSPSTEIWKYENRPLPPPEEAHIAVGDEDWQVLAAVTIVPAYINRHHFVPLYFHESLGVNLTTYGTSPMEVSATIARNFWQRAELVVLVSTYQVALSAVPLASFLNAPLLVGPSEDLLEMLGTRCAILVGDMDAPTGISVFRLLTTEDLWDFQTTVMEMKGETCNYIIITNPWDIGHDANILYRRVSLASAILSAYRSALVVADDFTSDRSIVNRLGRLDHRDDELYQSALPYFEKVKYESYKAETFLMEKGHQPRFLALVGGPFALPDYVLDIHATYHFWDQEVHYVPSASPYANISLDVPHGFVGEDLAVGRIIAPNLDDLSSLLMRTFNYRTYLDGWGADAALVDGHRLNQPEPEGPNTTSKRPFHPSEEIMNVWQEEGYNVTYYLPRNETDPYDDNLTVPEIMASLQNISLLQIVAHGNEEYIRFETGVDPDTGERKNYHLNGEEVAKLRFSGPAVIYVIACHTGTFSSERSLASLPLAFLHAGAVAYIAPITCQAVCFWNQSPEGPASDQAVMTWERAVTSHDSLGEAHAEAKILAYSRWSDPRTQEEDPDGPTFHYFGDPALEIYKPLMPFEEVKRIDLVVTSDLPLLDLKRGVEVRVTLEAYDLETGRRINVSASWTFGDQTFTGRQIALKPDADGWLILYVSSDGYEPVEARFRIDVISGERGGDDRIISTLLIIGLLAFLILVMEISSRYWARVKK